MQEETINDLVDTTLEDEKMDTSKPFYEMKEDEEHHKAESLGDLRDQNIRMKQKQIEEEELKLTITKDEDKEAPKKRKSSKKKKINKKRQKKSKENVENIILPEKFRKIPDNIINLVKPGDIILNANPNGACGPNAAAAHIFEDQNEGPELRKAMNDHITKYWSHYQTKIDFPYEREVGNAGDKVYFEAENGLLDFISNDERATYLWSDYEELHAISNLYQIKIKVISLASPDSIPVVSMIGPEPELAPFANLPAGIVPDMVLLHSNNSHFDLVVHKESRLLNQQLIVNNTELSEELKALKNEIETLRKDHENLINTHAESLKQIEALTKSSNISQRRKKSKRETEPAEANDKDDTNNDEKVLLTSKKSGFSRINPMTQPEKKKENKKSSCQICDKEFLLESDLQVHMEEHTTDDEGDWSCEECSYQTNTEAHLNNHLKHSEHKTKFVCKLCESTFTTGNKLSKHRTSNHKTFKPCKNLPNCQYKDDCLFNHKMLNIDTFICYECGYETKNLNHLMEHRKANHKINTCRKFLQNKCIFNASSCWYNHNNRQGQPSERKKMNPMMLK